MQHECHVMDDMKVLNHEVIIMARCKGQGWNVRSARVHILLNTSLNFLIRNISCASQR